MRKPAATTKPAWEKALKVIMTLVRRQTVVKIGAWSEARVQLIFLGRTAKASKSSPIQFYCGSR